MVEEDSAECTESNNAIHQHQCLRGGTGQHTPLNAAGQVSSATDSDRQVEVEGHQEQKNKVQHASQVVKESQPPPKRERRERVKIHDGREKQREPGVPFLLVRTGKAGKPTK